MAGLEQIEIHSKSYLVRWVDAAGGHTISWSLQPHKKSINFGIFKHPGGSTSSGLTPRIPPASNANPGQSNDEPVRTRSRGQSINAAAGTVVPTTKVEAGSVTERLESLGMKSVAWHGRCEADEVSMGRYDVPEGDGGMYGMVFDNTHAKQLSKTVTFVVMTFPTAMPPKSGIQSRFRGSLSRQGSGNNLAKGSPAMKPIDDSSELPFLDAAQEQTALVDPTKNASVTEFENASGATFFTGVLSKKRRKRNQGWARRFFSLDYTSSTLSYYKSRNSSALRGAIPLSLAAIGADAKSRHISIDSGAEIWLLRAQNTQDFESWRDALERASERSDIAIASASESSRSPAPPPSNPIEDREWGKAETLVGKVAGITDSVRRLAKDTDPKYIPGAGGLGITDGTVSGTPSPLDSEGSEYFSPSKSPERPRFWSRKASTGGQSPSGMFRKSFSGQKPSAASLSIPSSAHTLSIPKHRPSSSSSNHHTSEDVHDRCMAVLRDLDAVVAEFSSLIAESRRRRQPDRPKPVMRKSFETTASQEFFDAEDTLENARSHLLRIRGDSELDGDRPAVPEPNEAGDDSGSESDLDEAEESFASSGRPGHPSLFPAKPKSLAPLPLKQITRRSTVPPSVGTPPSLIAFLRKNVGKDLSTISMPVTANEPLSLLQRQAEQMEYSSLLDSAVTASEETGERLLYIMAFALSPLSNSRLKERAIRKPFNPMLGETFEFLSPATSKASAYRYISEKVTHRPVRVACQAESEKWTFTHSPSPIQKFWGKSAEITTHGKARVILYPSSPSSPSDNNNTSTDPSTYSWTPATAFLRNVLAGEKYIEPVSSMTVFEESSGRKAVATFKSGGMFSGRSEDVTVQVFDPHGRPMSLGLTGKWTSHLTFTGGSAGTEIWHVNDLPPDAAKRYGMTCFAASLNEITPLERLPETTTTSSSSQIAIPPTDSRLRPDQRVYEQGQIDEAEKLKAQLEEAQRRRRKDMENAGEEWVPRWFDVVGRDGDEDVWGLKSGNEHSHLDGINNGSAGLDGNTDAEVPGAGVGTGSGAGDYWSVRAAVVDFKKGKWDGVKSVFEIE